MHSSDVIRVLEAGGWVRVRINGTHHQFKHPTKPGLVTVPHPNEDLPKGTISSILRHARLK